MRKLRRDLQRTFPDATIKPTRSGHYAVFLHTGGIVFVAGTPSDWRFMRNTIAKARRLTRQAPSTEHQQS